jgi:DNA-binding beta-propeller fold protein YncE
VSVPVLVVALGNSRYKVDRPFGDLTDVRGQVTDVACDSSDNVYVLFRSDPIVEPDGSCLIKLDRTGKRIAAWGLSIVADAHMLAIDSDNCVFIVDRDAHQIVVFNQNGQQVGEIGKRNSPGEPFNHPTDIAFSHDGSFYVTDGYGAGRVHRFGKDRKLITTWGEWGRGPGQFMNPHAVWVLPDSNLVVADRENDRLQFFSPEGKLLNILTDFVSPLDIWGDDEGNLFVTDLVPSLTLLRIKDGVRERCRPVLNGAHGISRDSLGHVYLAEPRPSRVTRLIPSCESG